MKSVFKLPLYLGLMVLVVSILVSAVKVGNEQAFTSDKTRANISGASLIMKFTAPNLVSVLLTSEKEISGADVTVKYNGDKISILPSSLTAGPNLVTSGGNVDSKANTFSFSAVSQKMPVTSGIVASFTVISNETGKTADADIQIVSSSTGVYAKSGSENILSQTQGAKFQIPKQ